MISTIEYSTGINLIETYTFHKNGDKGEVISKKYELRNGAILKALHDHEIKSLKDKYDSERNIVRYVQYVTNWTYEGLTSSLLSPLFVRPTDGGPPCYTVPYFPLTSQNWRAYSRQCLRPPFTFRTSEDSSFLNVSGIYSQTRSTA
jgi:hypothetical protein